MATTTVTESTPSKQHGQTQSRRIAVNLGAVIGLTLLVLLAVIMRVITYERHLPVLEHIDETYRFIHAYQIRDDAPLGDRYGEIEWTVGFPPLQPWIAIVSQRLVERFVPFPYPPDYIRALRGLSAAANVGTVVLLAGCGWLLGRKINASVLSGLLVALPWAVAPRIVGTGNLALMDPLIFPAVALTLFCTIYAIQEDAAWGVFISLIAVIVAIYFKYLLVYALWLPFCAVAVLVWRRGLVRMLGWIAVMAVVSAVTSGYLVFVHRALELDNRESTAFYESGLANMLSPARNWDNLLFTLQETVGIWLFAVVILGGTIAHIYRRRTQQPTFDLRWLAVLLPFTLGCLMLTSSVDILRTWEPHWFRVRYTLPMAQALLIIWGVAATQVIIALRDAIPERGKWVSTAVALLIAGPFTVMSVRANIENAYATGKNHTLVNIWNWSDSSLPNPDGDILVSGGSMLHRAWNRPWSGYNGATTFEWEFSNRPFDRSPQQYVSDGFGYFAATDRDFEVIFNAPEMDAWVAQLYPLKVIEPGAAVNETTYFYRMLPPDVETQVRFGERIRLVGYDLSADTLSGGDRVIVRPYWQATAQPTANYSMFVHLLPEDDTVPITQFDGAPASVNRLPITWNDPAEVIVGTDATLVLPDDIPAGNYSLALGLYNFETGERLRLPSGDDAYRILLTIN